MAVDIGPKIGIEGEAEYRRELNNIITQTKTLRSDMRALESQFDANTTEQEKAAKKVEVLTQAYDAQEKRVASVEKMYDLAKQELGENATETLKWKQALNTANIELNNTERELNEAKAAADGYGDEVEESADENGKFAKSIGDMMSNEKLADFFNKASEAVSKFSGAAIDAAKELDVGYDNIVKKTGATGDSLEELKGIADSVYGSMPVSMEDVGAAVGEVQTRLNLTGDALEETSRLFLQFAAINNTDVSTSVDTVQKALAAFGLDASDTARILDVMTAAGQASGVGMDELAGAMVKNAGALTELGLSAEQSIMFIGRLEKSGVDSETALTGMSRALKNATKQGIPLDRALSDLEDTILNGADGMDGLTAAYDLFGRSGDKIYNALKTGSISFKDLTESVDDYSDTVTSTYEATIDPWDKTTVMMNNVKRAGSELAGTALSTLEPAMNALAGVAQKAADKFETLPEGVQTTIGAVMGVGTVAAQVVPKVLSFVNTIKSIQAASSVAQSVKALAGATETADKAQKAFNITALANPYVLLAVGVAAAVSAIAGLAYAFADADEQAVQMKADAEALTAAMNETSSASLAATDSATAQIAQMEAQDRIADDLVKTVTDLSSKEHKSAEEVTELRKAVKQLNDIYPDLNLEYDEASGKLNMTNEELAENIKLTRAQAEAAAYAKILTDAISRQLELQINAEAAQKQLNAAIGEYGDEVLTAKNRGVSNIFDMDTFKTAQAGADTINLLSDAVRQDTQAMDENQAVIDTATEHLEALGMSVDTITGEVTDETGAVVGLDEAAEGASESIEGLTDAEAETEEQVTMTAEEIQAASEKIIEAYASTAESAHDSAMTQGSLWEEMAQKESTSIEQMMQGLQSHIDAYTKYNTNLETLLSSAEYSTDAGFRNLVNYIAQGGIASAQELAVIVEAFQNGDTRLAEMVEGFGNMDLLAGEYGENLATVETVAEYGLEAVRGAFENSGVPDAAAGMVSEVARVMNSNEPKKAWEKTLQGLNGKSADSYEATKALLDSMEQGVTDGTKDVEAAEDGITGSVDQTHKEITAQKAKAITAGETVARGYATGIKNGGKDAATAMRGVYRSGVPTISADILASAKTAGESLAKKVQSGIEDKQSGVKTAGESLASHFTMGVNAKQGDATTAGNNLVNAVKGPIDTMTTDAHTWGVHFMQNFNRGIMDMMPNTEAAAKAVAQKVKQYLGHSTPEAGPLKDDNVWGLHLAQNIASGMMQGIPMVETASYDLARAVTMSAPLYADAGAMTSQSMTANELYDIFSAALADADMKVIIGTREFGRILRNVGGAA